MTTHPDRATACWLNSLSLEAVQHALRHGYVALRSRPYCVVAIKGLASIEVSIWSGQHKQHQTFVPINDLARTNLCPYGASRGSRDDGMST